MTMDFIEWLLYIYQDLYPREGIACRNMHDFLLGMNYPDLDLEDMPEYFVLGQMVEFNQNT